MSGVLYLLPNRIADRDPEETLPVGTLRVARTCGRFLAENAKSARAFLKAVGHPSPIAELEILEIGHAPDSEKFNGWLQPVLEGIDTAIVSESGCPAVADPGSGLVLAAHRLGIRVVPLVGPCSILMTLMASGLNGQRFRFWGYLPVDRDERRSSLLRLERESAHGETELFIETPYRNNVMLSALSETLHPETLVTVAHHLTGDTERIETKTAAQWRKSPVELPKMPTVFALLAGKGKR